MRRLYQNEGWHIIHLARYFDIHHSSVQQHIQNLPRNVPPVEYCPPEVDDLYHSRQKRSILDYSYDEHVDMERRRRAKQRATCPHQNIVIICLKCGQHFEETKTSPAKAHVVFI